MTDFVPIPKEPQPFCDGHSACCRGEVLTDRVCRWTQPEWLQRELDDPCHRQKIAPNK